ncbi:DUF2516 family protein [Corynebacterium alimapuense]|uniref:DUF2516 domain-containing protein n=1 Tax=Corynebacterium alimapuense TaxID=1576874 RepID=A0A3M8K6Y6_9CORY|nr:DUF2516 family protein [Corynebacterium alimapuense]RNE48977.1 DUF2516 domain-containing protein [Corynebacterium alimapuense]
MTSAILLNGYFTFELILYSLIAMAGLAGAFFAATTRDDAYPAGDRKSKWIWVGILFASAFVVFTRMPFLSWIGMVVIGLYWFDVRPQLRSLINGSNNW